MFSLHLFTIKATPHSLLPEFFLICSSVWILRLIIASPYHLVFCVAMMFVVLLYCGSLLSVVSIDLTFHIPNPTSLAGVFINFQFPFWGFGWNFIKDMLNGMGLLAQPPARRSRVLPLFVWVIILDLSAMGGPTSSNATTSVTLRIIWRHKPNHCIKVGLPSGGSCESSVRNNLQILVPEVKCDLCISFHLNVSAFSCIIYEIAFWQEWFLQWRLQQFGWYLLLFGQKAGI